MPVSTTVHLSHCLEWILSINPRSVLDVGCGFGQWGFLCREHLDVFHGRVQPEDWQIRIDAIELFEPYIQAHQRALYTSIRVGDVRDAAPAINTYDLIIAGDVIEHLDKDDGERVIEQLYEKAERALLVTIPIGEGWEHPEEHGNPGELHRSVWRVEDFEAYPTAQRLFALPCGAYGTFLLTKDCPVETRVAALVNAAERRADAGDLAKSERYARRAQALDPSKGEAALLLADVLLRRDHVDEARKALEDAVEANPAFHTGCLMLAKLAKAQKQADEARTWLETLLARKDLPQAMRAEAEAILEDVAR